MFQIDNAHRDIRNPLTGYFKLLEVDVRDVRITISYSYSPAIPAQGMMGRWENATQGEEEVLEWYVHDDTLLPLPVKDDPFIPEEIEEIEQQIMEDVQSESESDDYLDYSHAEYM